MGTAQPAVDAAPPHPGAFPAVSSTAAVAARLPGLDGPLRPPVSAVPDLNAIPEDAPVTPGLPTAPADSAAPTAGATGDPAHERPAAGSLLRDSDGSLPATERAADQPSHHPLANGYPLSHGPTPADGSVPAVEQPLATAEPGGIPATDQHGAAKVAASTVGKTAVQNASVPELAAEAPPVLADPAEASADGVSFPAEADGTAQDDAPPTVPAIAAQAPVPMADVAGTVAAAEASAMASADRAVAVQEAMEVRRDPS